MGEFATSAGPVTIGPYQPGDEHGILELFKLVFDVDRPLDVWNWEFRDCPAGIHAFLGKLDDGTVVSQFAGIPVHYRCRDRDVVFAQIVDSMVHPELRSGLKKRGLFARTVDEYVDRYGHLDEEVIMMGLPNPPAYRIGHRLCGYSPMTRIYTHGHAVEPDTSLGDIPDELNFARTPYQARLVDRFSQDADGLWERLAPRYDVIAHRHAAYLNWRYTASPLYDYDQIELRAPDGELQGVAVLRHDWLDEPDTIIAEWFVDHDRPGAPEALLEACFHQARKNGARRLRCLLNHMARESRFFEDREFHLLFSQFRLVSRTYAPDFVDPTYLNRHWYYTMGDFDVV